MIAQQTHDLADLYALDALETADTAEFEEHLARCEPCVARVAEALTATAALVDDAAPPNHVWDRIVEELDSSSARVLPLLPRRRLISVGPLSIAAAALVGLVAVLVGGLTSDQGEALALAAASAAEQPGATIADFVVDDVVVAQVVLSQAGTGFLVPTDALPDLDGSLTYQLWVVDEEGAVISGGVLGNTPGVSTFTWTDDVSGFALTREVAGGVPVSAGDVVAVAGDL